MTIPEIKKSLRKEMLIRRNDLDLSLKANLDQKICEELLHLVHSIHAKTVHAYIPFAGEIDIKPLLQNLLENNIQVVCPKTLPKRTLENRILTSLSELETGIMGTLHPKEPLVYNGSFDLIIVPGLAYDQEKYRLGYGGGYYDGFLGLHPKSLKVGIFYSFQQVDQVPREAHDLRLDELIISQ